MVRLIAAFAIAAFAMAVPASAQDEEPPDGVDQLMPRGGIPAVFSPEFIAAGDAAMPDSAWVLGVYLDGEARAYDLNLLNHHEVVNDVIGGRPIASVW